MIQSTCLHNAGEELEVDIRGKPATKFLSSSERSKRRKTENICSTFSPEELSYAAQM